MSEKESIPEKHPKSLDHPELPASTDIVAGPLKGEFLSQLESGLQQALSGARGIQENISPSQKVLVALSGGPDSTGLLAGLSIISAASGIKLQACHINHHLRGAESDLDQKFCQEI